MIGSSSILESAHEQTKLTASDSKKPQNEKQKEAMSTSKGSDSKEMRLEKNKIDRFVLNSRDDNAERHINC